MRHDPDALMIFAAGFGTRMGVLTKTRPKPMIEVAGKPLIDHALDLAQPVSPSRIVINTHYLPDVLEGHLLGRAVTVINESPDILDTGGGLKNARGALGTGPAFTLNPDAMWKGPNPLEQLAAAWRPEHMGALLMLVPKGRAREHKGEGDFLLAETGKLSRGPGLVYSGAQIIDPALAAAMPEEAFSLNLVWNALMNEGRLYGIAYDGEWCDVGSPEGINSAEDMLADDPV